MRTRIFDIRNLIYIALFGVLGSVLVKGQDHCLSNLVTGPNGVKDEQLSASSTYDKFKYAAKHARLHTYRGWMANSASDEYIQVDFDQTNKILAVQTQGRHDWQQRTTSYAISYSHDDLIWTFLMNNKSERIFPGNSDCDSVVTNVLPEVVRAKYFRIHPRTSIGHRALRFELIGCKEIPSKSWKVHPIVITGFQDSLWNKSASHLGKCATYCYNEATCQSFVFNGDSGTCTGFRQEFLRGYRLNNLQGNLYFLDVASLDRYTLYLNENGYTRDDNVIYKIYTDQVDIFTAQSTCKNDDTYLLAVRNVAVLDRIQKDTMITTLHPFVDGSLMNGAWVYGKGVEIPTKVWAVGEPSYNHGNCAVVTEPGLKAVSCSARLPFICGF